MLRVLPAPLYLIREHFDISLILPESLDDADMQPGKYDKDQLFFELILSHIWQNFYVTRSFVFLFIHICLTFVKSNQYSVFK